MKTLIVLLITMTTCVSFYPSTYAQKADTVNGNVEGTVTVTKDEGGIFRNQTFQWSCTQSLVQVVCRSSAPSVVWIGTYVNRHLELAWTASNEWARVSGDATVTDTTTTFQGTLVAHYSYQGSEYDVEGTWSATLTIPDIGSMNGIFSGYFAKTKDTGGEFPSSFELVCKQTGMDVSCVPSGGKSDVRWKGTYTHQHLELASEVGGEFVRLTGDAIVATPTVTSFRGTFVAHYRQLVFWYDTEGEWRGNLH